MARTTCQATMLSTSTYRTKKQNGHRKTPINKLLKFVSGWGFSVDGDLAPSDLSFSDLKHFGTTNGASSFLGWLAIFHCNSFSVWVISLFATFYTIHCCHRLGHLLSRLQRKTKVLLWDFLSSNDKLELAEPDSNLILIGI